MIGFMNLGDINHHLHRLEQQLETCDAGTSPPLANTVFVFMVRGIFSSLKFPYATFSANSVSADQLLPLYIEALFRLERCGFKVIGITLDGYSANRRLLSLLFDEKRKSRVKYKTKNPFSQPIRSIFFFSDPPHLLKTIRNSFANSSRNLMVSPLVRYNSWLLFLFKQKNGQNISWKFVVDLYQMGAKSMGLTT